MRISASLRSPIAWCWLWVFLLAGVPAARADDAPPTAADFESGLEKAEGLCRRTRCKQGLDVLRELLETHARKPYVLARRAGIEDLMWRLSFGAAVKQPNPKKLVSGDLKSWNARSGRIRIEYKPGSADDLKRIKTFLFHPARFKGPTTIEIEADGSLMKRPTVLFGGDPDEKTGDRHFWRVHFGNNVIAYHILGHARKVLDKLVGADKLKRIAVKVTDKKVTAHVNRRRIGSVDKPKDIFGQMGFQAERWKKVTFIGEIEPSWIQSKVDKVVQDQRDEFKKTYKPSDHLPAWLLAAPKTTAASSDPAAQMPAEFRAAHLAALGRVQRAIEDEKWTQAMMAIRDLVVAGAPEANTAYLRSTVHMLAGDAKTALRHINRVLELNADFLWAHLMQGVLLQRLGRRDASLAAFALAVKKHPDAADAYQAAALAALRIGDREAARRFSKSAASRGVRSPRLDLLATALIKAERGPVFTKSYEHKSRHYRIVSDIDKNTCVEAARLLEHGHFAYRAHLDKGRDDNKQRFPVYIFRGKAGFSNYIKDLGPLMGKPSEKTAGLYSPLLKQLLIWNLPNRDEMLETIRHEGSHQYLDALMVDPPVWFNEGLAVYHEGGYREGGRLRFGRPPMQYVKLLRKHGLVPAATFLTMTPRKFYALSSRAYGQAWLMVHLLRHGSKTYKDKFDKLVEALKTRTAAEVMKEFFPAKDMSQLDADLENHLRNAEWKR